MRVPLEGVTVLDLSTTVPGAYSARLLASYGANVVMVEPPDEGSPLRRVPPFVGGEPGPDSSTLFAFLGGGKQSVALDLHEAEGRAALDVLIAGADVVIDTHTSSELAKLGLGYEQLAAINPRLVVVSVTPFGLSGPYADYQATALELSAAGGWLVQSGEPGRVPLVANSSTIAEFMPGLIGANAAVMGLRAARRDGAGRLYEVATMESLLYATRYYETTYFATGHEVKRAGDSLSGSLTYRVFPASDGYIVSTASTEAQIDLLSTLTGADALGLETREQRLEHRDELIAAIGDWFAQRTRDEGFHETQQWRIPVAPATTVDEIPELEQSRARKMFEQVEHPIAGSHLQPRAAALIGDAPLPGTPAPSIGEHTEELTGAESTSERRASQPAAAAGGASASDLPLEGVRVLDLTNWWAGPIAGAFLGDMGAEVIKIEAVQKLDPWRGMLVPEDEHADEAAAYEASPTYLPANRNKLGLTLNLKTPEGVELFKSLVAVSDVVLENFSPRVMTQFGLDYANLKQLNPKIVVASISGFGHESPWRDYVSFAAVAESLSGITGLVGYDGGGPLIHGALPSDPVAGMTCALGIVLALEAVERGGEGQHVDLSQFEASVPFVADAFMEWSLTGNVRERTTNRSTSLAPHGVYRTRGDDHWVALSVASDEQWQRFATASGRDEFASEAFATFDQRLEQRTHLDELIGAWTVDCDADELASLLQRHGVAAMPVLAPPQLLEDEHLLARGFFQTVDRSHGADYPLPSPPIRVGGERTEIRRPAPRLGEHNRYVLHELIGLTDEAIEEMEAAGVIGTRPAW